MLRRFAAGLAASAVLVTYVAAAIVIAIVFAASATAAGIPAVTIVTVRSTAAVIVAILKVMIAKYVVVLRSGPALPCGIPGACFSWLATLGAPPLLAPGFLVRAKPWFKPLMATIEFAQHPFLCGRVGPPAEAHYEAEDARCTKQQPSHAKPVAPPLMPN